MNRRQLLIGVSSAVVAATIPTATPLGGWPQHAIMFQGRFVWIDSPQTISFSRRLDPLEWATEWERKRSGGQEEIRRALVNYGFPVVST